MFTKPDTVWSEEIFQLFQDSWLRLNKVELIWNIDYPDSQLSIIVERHVL